MIEHKLRPLFGVFEAATLPTGIYASAVDFTEDRPTSPTVLLRIDRAVEKLAVGFARIPATAARPIVSVGAAVLFGFRLDKVAF